MSFATKGQWLTSIPRRLMRNAGSDDSIDATAGNMSHTTKRKRRRKKRLPVDPVEAIIDSLSDEGRGISH
ncbi:MAG: hypothetical protein HKP12_05135, partial [Gammaproteobacteria bacterium]|nr:hypothetical protein [Gammaproteobacteria bacterium]